MTDYHQPNLSEVEKGFKLAQDRCLILLEHSKQLLSNRNLNGSIILAVFALEELGRMVILSDRYNESKKTSKSVIRINKNRKKDDFYNHTIKQEKALSILPRGIENLRPAPFDDSIFDPKCFDATDTLVNKDLRERFTFIDYNDTGWILPPPVDQKRLTNFIIKIETHCRKLSI